MAGLPKSFIKKYGVSKKAWAMYRSSRSSSKRTEVKPMARRRSRRSSAVRFARKAAKRGGVGNSAALFQVDAMAYGAVRQYVSNAIAPATSMIPLGTLSDEIGMGVLCYLVAKNTSGMISNVAKKGLVIENARVGEALVNGGLGVITGSASSGSQSQLYG